MISHIVLIQKFLQKLQRETSIYYSLAIAVIVIVVYANSLGGAFIYDDEVHILHATEIQTLGWKSMFGEMNYTRPVVGLTFAINYALGGSNPWGYHLFNLLVHLCSTLILFGIVRRTLEQTWINKFFQGDAVYLACVIALLWGIHPLNTEAVTYVTQRYESVMGLFSLLTIYATLRSAFSPVAWRWNLAGCVFCLLALCSKQSAIGLPILVLLFDRAFLSGSIRSALTCRKALYVGMIPSYLIMGFIGITAPPVKWAGFDVSEIYPWWKYGLTQFKVIVHYFQLAVWPDPLCFSYYGMPPVQSFSEVVPEGVFILSLAALTVYTLCRHPGFGVIGAWVFIFLGPTSSIFPLNEVAAERRMYLPLAALITAVIILIYLLISNLKSFYKTLATGIVLMVILIFSWLTIHRNQLYEDVFFMWDDVIRKQPGNPKAYNNAAVALMRKGRLDDAILYLKKAILITPNYHLAHTNMGFLLEKKGDYMGAVQHFQASLNSSPVPETHYHLAKVLHKSARKLEAIPHYREAIRLKPKWEEPMRRLAWILATYPDASVRNTDEALEIARTLCQPTCSDPSVQETLAAAYANQGNFEKAEIIAGVALKNLRSQAQEENSPELFALIPVFEKNHEEILKKHPLRESFDEIQKDIQ